MKVLTGITDSPSQQSLIALPDGSSATLVLKFVPNQMGWFFDLSSGDFLVTGQRLVTFPNILRQYRNQITYGLAVYTPDGLDPLQQTDFASGYASLLLLEPGDVALVEANHFTRND